MAGVLIAALTAYLSAKAYNYLLGIALFGAITTWIIILATHLRFQKRYPKRGALSVRAPLTPYLQWAGLALLVAVLITMGLDEEFWNIALLVGVPWVLFVSLIFVVLRRRRTAVTLSAPTEP
jgi:L-asparagine transporter-like permease